MRIHLVTKRPDLRGMRGGFGLSEPEFGQPGAVLLGHGDEKGAPRRKQEIPGYGAVRDQAGHPRGDQLFHRRKVHLQLVAVALDDADVVAALDDGNALLRGDLGRRAHRIRPGRHAKAGDRHQHGSRKRGSSRDDGHSADAAFASEEADGRVNQKSEGDPQAGIDRPVADGRRRFRPEQSANEHSNEVKGPKADDRLRRQPPVGKAALRRES